MTHDDYCFRHMTTSMDPDTSLTPVGEGRARVSTKGVSQQGIGTHLTIVTMTACCIASYQIH